MISAAVIEDNREFARILQEKITGEPGWEQPVSVALYHTPADFLDSIAEGKHIDAAFLDVEMPGMNGLELAERIRSADREMLLVFVSSFSKYAMEGYQVYAFDYLLKSQLDQRWNRLVERLRKALAHSREKLYTVQTANRTERIPIDDILYIYKEDKYVIIVTGSQQIPVRKTMQEMAGEFGSHSQFIQVKRGILINMEKVQRATARELLMADGECITIGRMYVEKVRTQMHAYLGK